ncbi:glycosyltransferase family 4 protein [Haloterrigena sp. SYSU A121-1]|uniref:Glycosyltransferase family 4 protein n=1 Tax=Haloterrigena gelatinilytica TaxID=2741724 RepID=A0A8J8KH77_9EURY|nr:glycosyltransferase family 4 protein [Haloterrigena gelatinilytica]NUB92802.1 glycosyltransferase family 4 protein [Haloterrigena gelatinilytica]
MIRVLSLTTTDWRSFYQSQMTALERADVEVTTLPVPSEHRAREDDVQRRTPLDYARYLPQVLRAAREDYDLVHANYGLTFPFAVAASALPGTDLPVVCTLWGGEYRDNPYADVIRWFTARADRVVVPSNAMADRVDRPCHNVPFPVDTDRFRPVPRDEARERVGWETDERIVLFPYAPSREEKNYPLAERVVDGLPDDVRLRTVANQPYEEVPYYLNAADAVLITSRYESGPMTIKEAAACNVPVVSRDVGFAREVLEPVSDSHVVADDDALQSRLADVLAGDRRSDGRAHVTEYTVDEMGDRLRAVYQRCLENEA